MNYDIEKSPSKESNREFLSRKNKQLFYDITIIHSLGTINDARLNDNVFFFRFMTDFTDEFPQ